VVLALTLLPVVLASIGPKVDWPRFAAGSKEGAFWHRWAEIISRRHWIAAAVGAVILAVLVAEATTIALGQSKADSLAKSGDAYQGLHALETSGIPVGVLAPYEMLVTAGQPAGTAQQLAHVSGVWGAVAPAGAAWHRAGTSIVAVLPTDDASSSAGRATVDRVRQAAKRLPGTIRVGGPGPLTTDFIAAVYGNFPLMIILIAVV